MSVNYPGLNCKVVSCEEREVDDNFRIEVAFPYDDKIYGVIFADHPILVGTVLTGYLIPVSNDGDFVGNCWVFSK